MSTTQQQTEIEKYLNENAESTSQALHNKPFAELDEKRQQQVMAGAYRELKNTVLYEPQPGTCFQCGRDVPFQKIQCWYCHEGTHLGLNQRPRGKIKQKHDEKYKKSQ